MPGDDKPPAPDRKGKVAPVALTRSVAPVLQVRAPLGGGVKLAVGGLLGGLSGASIAMSYVSSVLGLLGGLVLGAAVGVGAVLIERRVGRG